MSWFEVFQITQTVVMGIAFGLAYVLGLRRKVDDQRLASIERRLERAGQEHSRWAGITQRLVLEVAELPEELRKIFLSTERATEIIGESRRDREALWRELRDVRRRMGELRG